jgi:hypothetical protein
LASLLRVSATEVGGKRTDMEGMFGLASHRMSLRELEGEVTKQLAESGRKVSSDLRGSFSLWL